MAEELMQWDMILNMDTWHTRFVDAMSDHLKHVSLDAHIPIVRRVLVMGQRRPDAHAEYHVAHVADGAVGDQSLEVGLGHCGKSAVNHADDTDNADEPHQVEAALRADGITDSQDAVAAHF